MEGLPPPGMQVPSPGQASKAPMRLPEDRPITSHGVILRRMLGVAVGISVVLIMRSLAAYLRGEPYGVVAEDPDDVAMVGALAQTLWSAVFLAAGLAFAGWLFRVAKNNIALGASGVTWGPGWAWGGWFIPLANLIIPFLVLREVWKASDPASAPGRTWTTAKVWPGLGWWWSLGVLNFFVQAVGVAFGFEAALAAEPSSSTADLPLWLHLVDAASMLVLVPAGFLAMSYTRGVEERQAARRSTYGPSGGGQGTFVPPFGEHL
jgi:hypothetical protein